jgi:23S rRNA (cytidine1920-2'-O)/16S rRNA (cytidine1409-2'-O)-methyltransferase
VNDSKTRIDQLLAERGLAESRTAAQRMVMAGQVWVDGQPVHKASERFRSDSQVEVRGAAPYVSRGGEKLEAALRAFGIDPTGWVCADVGASTGGFSDCLLQHGASKVYAIDVGKGLLHWRLRNDPRVVLMEETNARYLDELPEPVRLATIDVSFISLSLILPQVIHWIAPDGDVVALIKPQFEAGRSQVGRGGVVRDPGTHRQVLQTVIEQAIQTGIHPHGLIRSPLVGPKGNIEFLIWLLGQPGKAPDPLIDSLF